MQRLIRFLAISAVLALILAGCIVGDDDDSEDDSSPGGALSTVVSEIGGDDEEDETEEAEEEATDDAEDEQEEAEEDEEEESSGVVWTGEGDSGDEEYDICFVVSDDGSMLTVANDDCDDFSFTIDIDIEVDQGDDCELEIETAEDIPIENGGFEVTTDDTTIRGTFDSDSAASGTVEGVCSLSWEASPES